MAVLSARRRRLPDGVLILLLASLPEAQAPIGRAARWKPFLALKEDVLSEQSAISNCCNALGLN